MKKVLLYLILVMAIVMAGTVAYVSVGGLLKVFSGAGTLGLILFTSIEIAKVVATSAIHTYGKIIGWFYNLLLSLGIVIAMGITSMGIYGFLSSTYKESYSKMENIDSRLNLIKKKSEGYQKQLDALNVEKESVDKTITELSKGLSNNVIQYKDKDGNIITTTSSATRKSLEKQLDRAMVRQGDLNIKIDELNNNVFESDNEMLEVNLGNDVASELGPLKYLAEVTGTTMDNVMKWFILLLIVIGDPMAILMVIVFNKVANVSRKENEGVTEGVTEGKKNIIDTVVEIEEDKEEIVIDTVEEIEEEIEELKEDVEDLEEDIQEDKEEIEELKEDIEELVESGDNEELNKKLEEIEERERALQEKEDGIKKLDDEIKEWENMHWKLKRGRKPPSAID